MPQSGGKPSKKHPSRQNEAANAESSGVESVSVTLGSRDERPVQRAFPGPKSAEAFLRVAMEPNAYSELVAHAKMETEAEVCGVLAGDVCRDDEGLFVHVRSVIRGEAAKKGRAHVTFTQDTWTKIHDTIEKECPTARIVGWYHSHPGFGVSFSEMDLFIHRNFFPAHTQVAFITDPLGGEDSLCVNTDNGVKYVDSFWVGGRRRSCFVPADAGDSSPQGECKPAAEALGNLETRVTQLIEAFDDLRATVTRFSMAMAMGMLCAVVLGIGYVAFSQYLESYQPPKEQQYLPVPLRIEGQDVLLGIELKKWEIPPALTMQYHLVREIQLLRETLKMYQDAYHAAEAGGLPGGGKER